jgi:hypothetical protein
MATTIRSTALDFDRIKAALTADLSKKAEFTDFDFEASGISNILDVLAYNTHVNGLVANFATNESFIKSAQLRSSIVSRADELGMNLRSKTGSTAVLRISVNLSGLSVKPTTVTLPAYSEYTSTIDGTTHSFYTLDPHTAHNNGAGIYTFENELNNEDDTDYEITVYQGSIQTKTFYVGQADDYQVYVIPDADIDTATAKVYVYESTSSNSYEEYTSIKKAITVSSTSTYYDLREAPNGAYELTFGDGNTYGKAPTAGSKIVVTYLRPVGEAANGSGTFYAASSLTVSGQNFGQGVTTTTNSSGGSEKQSNESIRQSAPVAFATQQRLVTPEDYEALIPANFSQVKEVKAWGGQDNVPIDYGKVYLSVQFDDNVTANTKSIIKGKIKSQLTDKLSVTAITAEFVDPENIYLEVTIDFNYDPDLTGLTAGNLETKVSNTVSNYFDTISGFGKTFRKSSLLTLIDGQDESVLSSKADIKMNLQFKPIFGANSTAAYTLNFPTPIATSDDVNYRVETTNFTNENGTTVYIRNKLNTTQLELVNATSKAVITDNVGAYTPTNGEVFISKITPISSQNGSDYIEVRATPANESVIKPLRNYIFKLDSNRLIANAIRDDQNTKVSL